MSDVPTFCSNCGNQSSGEDFCPKCGTPKPTVSVPTSVDSSNILRRSNKNLKLVIIGGIIAAAIAISIVAAISINYYSLNNLQFRPASSANSPNLDFLSGGSNIQIEACNPTSFPATFEMMQWVVYYRESEVATLSVNGDTIVPNKITRLTGDFALNRETLASLFMQALGDAFSGSDTNIIEDDMIVKTQVDARVLGFIPYSQSQTYTAEEFQQISSSRNSETFSCTN